jgi:hypothetical protein
MEVVSGAAHRRRADPPKPRIVGLGERPDVEEPPRGGGWSPCPPMGLVVFGCWWALGPQASRTPPARTHRLPLPRPRASPYLARARWRDGGGGCWWKFHFSVPFCSSCILSSHGHPLAPRGGGGLQVVPPLARPRVHGGGGHGFKLCENPLQTRQSDGAGMVRAWDPHEVGRGHDPRPEGSRRDWAMKRTPPSQSSRHEGRSTLAAPSPHPGGGGKGCCSTAIFQDTLRWSTLASELIHNGGAEPPTGGGGGVQDKGCRESKILCAPSGPSDFSSDHGVISQGGECGRARKALPGEMERAQNCTRFTGSGWEGRQVGSARVADCQLRKGQVLGSNPSAGTFLSPVFCLFAEKGVVGGQKGLRWMQINAPLENLTSVPNQKA